jgi:hypothetical protein
MATVPNEVIHPGTETPLDEIIIYRDLLKQVIAQLGILKMYDDNFIFLETQMGMHINQVENTIVNREAAASYERITKQ